MNPKVFIIHASEDKERFVLAFATKLRTKGIDAWVDKWEVYPGDSLVDKIFEEGIKNAQAVIVVLSKYSVDKPWVREELNAGMIKKINKGSKLIPVIIAIYPCIIKATCDIMAPSKQRRCHESNQNSWNCQKDSKTGYT